VDQGRAVMTELVFPDSGFQRILLYNQAHVSLKEGSIYRLKSIW